MGKVFEGMGSLCLSPLSPTFPSEPPRPLPPLPASFSCDGGRLTAEGKGAQTVYRDKGSGKAVTRAEFVESRKDPRAKKREEEEADQVRVLRRD